ncbi:putative PDZ domain-containing protein [Frankia sp. AiPs1]
MLTAAALAVALPAGAILSAGAAQATNGTPAVCGIVGGPTGPAGTVGLPRTAPSTRAGLSPTPITYVTLRQSYLCMSDHYYAADPHRDQVLLAGAFAGLLAELDQLGLHRVDAPPAFAGDRTTDWNAFRAVFQRAAAAGGPATARQHLGIAVLNGMAASVQDAHAPRTYGEVLAGRAPRGIVVAADGARGSAGAPGEGAGERAFRVETDGPGAGREQDGPGEAFGIHVTAPSEGGQPSVTIAEVRGGPAAAAGLRAGDVIESIDSVVPISNGVPNQQVLDRLLPPESGPRTVRVAVRRPSTGRSWTVTLTLRGDGKGKPQNQRFGQPDGPARPGSQTAPALPNLSAPLAGTGQDSRVATVPGQPTLTTVGA